MLLFIQENRLIVLFLFLLSSLFTQNTIQRTKNITTHWLAGFGENIILLKIILLDILYRIRKSKLVLYLI